MSKTCSVENCNGKHYGLGYCNRHYNQFKRHGYILEKTRKDANEIIEYEDYAEMVLYDKYGNEVARTLIDLECVDVVKDYKWRLSTGYVFHSKLGLLHRFLMNPSDDTVVDHINRNPLDNRRENLRICTQHENSFNQSIRSDNTSGTTGVSWRKEKNKWYAYIRVNGKKKHLGYFNTKEEAAEARRQAEIEYFGEFAPDRE